LLYLPITYFGFHLLFPLNPPFWTSEATTEVMTDSVMTLIMVKTSINSIFFLLFAESLIYAIPIRRFLKLEEPEDQRKNTVIFSIAGTIVLTFWILDTTFVFFLLNPESRSYFDLFITNPYPQSIVSRFFVLLLCIIGSLGGIRLLRRLHFNQKKLEVSQLKYQKLTETISDCIWETSVDGLLTYISPRSLVVLGRTPEELMGKPMEEILFSEGSEKALADFHDSIQKEQSFEGLIHLYKQLGGKAVILESSGVPFFDNHGSFQGYRVIDRDITERMKAEEEVQLFKTIADQATYGVSIVDMDFIIQYVNEAYASIHGYTKQELIGKPISIFFSPEIMDQYQNMVNLLKKSESVSGNEVTHIRKDKSKVSILVSATKIYDHLQNSLPEELLTTSIIF